MESFEGYIDMSIRILVTAHIAEVLGRIYKTGYEFVKYRKYYMPNSKDIFNRAFSTTLGTKVTVFIIILIAAHRSVATGHLIIEISDFGFVPLYWLCIYIARISHSTLSYSYFIRERTGLDYGEGMASSYFHGYLKLVLPSGIEHGGGIKSRIEKFEAEHNIEFAVNKLVILIPNSLYISPIIQSKYLKKAHELESVVKNRAGVLRRYKNDVYRITEPINGKFYYVALEGATPLQSFFDALNYQLSCTWQMQQLWREILFKFYTSLDKLIKEWPETQDEVKLIFYNSKAVNGATQDVGEMLLTYFKSEWNETNDVLTDFE